MANKQLIRVGHSPDPDDAFMFYALAHDKIDTGNLTFRHELQDIETLNRRALNGELEVTAISIHAYAHLLDKYALLPSGCSMGDKYGPMVVARTTWKIDDLRGKKIAVPGPLCTVQVLVTTPGVNGLPSSVIVVSRIKPVPNTKRTFALAGLTRVIAGAVLASLSRMLRVAAADAAIA